MRGDVDVNVYSATKKNNKFELSENIFLKANDIEKRGFPRCCLLFDAGTNINAEEAIQNENEMLKRRYKKHHMFLK